MVSYLVAGRAGCTLLVIPFHPWAFQESVNVHHFLILNSKIWGPSASHVIPSLSAPAFQGPWIFPFSFKAKEERNGWDLMTGAGRCVCYASAGARACAPDTGLCFHAPVSCCHACALMLASIHDFSQIGQYRGMSMCVIPLMSVSEHVFRGRGV